MTGLPSKIANDIWWDSRLADLSGTLIARRIKCMALRLAVKEWAGVIDALANSDQILLIRKYPPDQFSFLLYPTYTYYSADKSNPAKFDARFAAKFQEKYLEMARDAALLELREPGIVQLRYLFEIDEVVVISKETRFEMLAPFMIWSPAHVATYAEKAYGGLSVWIGRTKKLSMPILAARQTSGGSITKYTHFEDFNVAGAAPVCVEDQYQLKRSQLLEVLTSATTGITQ
jgi:hypothetical protein